MISAISRTSARGKIRGIALRALAIRSSDSSFCRTRRADGLYNAGGGPIRFDASAGSGSHIGEEIDIVATLALMQRVKLQFGYSHFFGRNFVDNTNPLGVNGNADFFFSQAILQF
jgi:hypothetical protein